MVSAPAPLPVSDASHVSEARQVARQMAAQLGFDDAAGRRVALVTAELATNLAAHAEDGVIVIQPTVGPRATLEITALDRGPGMANVSRCFEDGFSTAGRRGVGLGAVARLASRCDAYSRRGQGTVVAVGIERSAGTRRRATGPLDVAALSIPKRGETVCGDAWAVEHHPDGAAIIVVDGLGHGRAAADAAAAAVTGFRQSRGKPPAERLALIHAALTPTRGAAGAIAHVNTRASTMSFAGIGNINATVQGPVAAHDTVSLSGILGHSARRISAFSYPWPSGAVFIAHSDGLTAPRDLDDYPGLMARTPLVIAGVLYRDLARGKDDATVVVARERRAVARPPA